MSTAEQANTFPYLKYGHIPRQVIELLSNREAMHPKKLNRKTFIKPDGIDESDWKYIKKYQAEAKFIEGIPHPPEIVFSSCPGGPDNPPDHAVSLILVVQEWYPPNREYGNRYFEGVGQWGGK